MPRGTKTPAPRLKLVIRRLPPTLPEETFWSVVEPFIEGKSTWRRYVKGRAGDAYGAHPQHSRAYVLMNDIESLVAFHAGFDGHLFRSKTGAEFQAVVEYAPIEKTPYKAKAKKDAREGTIDDDADYLSFLESLGAVEAKPPLEVVTPAPQPTSTPLLEALRASANKSKAKAAKKKDKKEVKEGKVEAKEAKKAAALASISEAANKRAPKVGGGGVVMVAGKGREVYVAPADAVVEGASTDSKKGDKKEKEGEKKKKPKSRKKKDKDGEAVEGGEIKDGLSKEGGKKEKPKPKSQPQSQAHMGGEGGGGAVAGGSAAVVDEASTDSKRKGRNRKRGGGPAVEGRPAPDGVVEETSGGRRGGKDRSVRGQATQILARNADGGAARGRPRAELLPTEARIDI